MSYLKRFFYNCTIGSNNGSLAVQVEETYDECCPFDTNDSAQEVEGDRTEPVLLQKGHQETDAEEEHSVHVLKFYQEKGNCRKV